MRNISNSDLDAAIKLLSIFSKTRGTTTREQNDRRMAALLSKKLSRVKESQERAENGVNRAANAPDAPIHQGGN